MDEWRQSPIRFFSHRLRAGDACLCVVILWIGESFAIFAHLLLQYFHWVPCVLKLSRSIHDRIHLSAIEMHALWTVTWTVANDIRRQIKVLNVYAIPFKWILVLRNDTWHAVCVFVLAAHLSLHLKSWVRGCFLLTICGVYGIHSSNSLFLYIFFASFRPSFCRCGNEIQRYKVHATIHRYL